jgi:O-antigen/teichoic acid export membrane protein
MTLIKTSLLSLLATGSKMLAALVISKAVAIYVGPTGLAVVGQFQNLIQILLTAGKGAIDTGVTKYTAEYANNSERLSQLFSTAFRISLAASVLVGVALVAASTQFSINNLLLAILNGLREVRTYIAINIFQSFFSLALTAGLIATLKLDGALIALVTNQSLVLFVVLWKLRHHPLIQPARFLQGFDAATATRLSRYALMTVVSAVAAPITSMLVRDHIARTIGIAQAGYWQAAWYVSSIYLTVVTTSLTIYYLPKLSGTTDKSQLRSELVTGYITIMPFVAVVALSVYLGREIIVKMVFTSEFDPTLALFKWMLIGDVVKLASWLLSYLMLAKAMTRAFVTTEILFSGTFVLLCMALTPAHGLQGIMYAHALNYVLYLLALIFLTRKLWR